MRYRMPRHRQPLATSQVSHTHGRTRTNDCATHLLRPSPKVQSKPPASRLKTPRLKQLRHKTKPPALSPLCNTLQCPSLPPSCTSPSSANALQTPLVTHSPYLRDPHRARLMHGSCASHKRAWTAILVEQVDFGQSSLSLSYRLGPVY